MILQKIPQRIRALKIAAHGGEQRFRLHIAMKNRRIYRRQHIRRRGQPGAVKAKVVVNAAQRNIPRIFHTAVKKQRKVRRRHDIQVFTPRQRFGYPTENSVASRLLKRLHIRAVRQRFADYRIFAPYWQREARRYWEFPCRAPE